MITINQTTKSIIKSKDAYERDIFIASCQIDAPTQDVTIEDISIIKGDVNVGTFTTTVPHITVIGDFKATGDVNVESLTVLGKTEISGALTANKDIYFEKEAVLNNDATFNGNVTFKRGVQSTGKINAQKLFFQFDLVVDGGITATSVKPVMYDAPVITPLNKDCALK